nr:rhomboid family intramembrane serine protease [Jiella sp. LLJ827]
MITDRGSRPPRQHPPAFNVPGIILVLVAAFGFVHAFRTLWLGPVAGSQFLLDFAFVPGCYGALEEVCHLRSPGADLWSVVTYSFLHGDWTHFGVNTVWLLAFGTPVARRLGTQWFLVFCLVGVLAGAAAFYVVNPTLVVPVIGASGVVSALMGGASRFAFVRLAPGRGLDAGINEPCVPIREALANRTVLVFVIAFFATNFFLGAGFAGAFGGGQVAWEAHLGGFLLGFLALPLFDERARLRR